MTTLRYSLFNAFAQKIAASGPGSWFFARTMHHFDRAFFRLSGGRTTMTSIFTGLPVVILTTLGAKSKLPRTLPVLCIPDDRTPDTFVIVASNWGQHHYPAWYFNLKANPRATCSIRGKAGEYMAREATGEEYEKLWQGAKDIYAGFPLYKQRASERRIPIMVMTPVKG